MLQTLNEAPVVDHLLLFYGESDILAVQKTDPSVVASGKNQERSGSGKRKTDLSATDAMVPYANTISRQE